MRAARINKKYEKGIFVYEIIIFICENFWLL